MAILPPNEKIVQSKKCKISGQEFFVTNKDLEFYDNIAPIFNGKKYAIPSPTLCPDERQRRRLCFRNERKLYHRKCDKTGNQIISIYSPDKPYKVYDQKVWWGDDWNPTEFYEIFDFSKSFFTQFHQLLKKNPVPGIALGFTENSDYCNFCYHPKNCYLCFCSDYCEDCEYLYGSFKSKNCFDCLNIETSENCYESVKCTNCYNVFYSQECTDSRDLFFCYDCSGCQNCFGCTNLRNKSWHFFNQPVSQIEYKKRLTEFLEASGRIQKPILEKLKKARKDAFYKASNLLGCESCTGDFLKGSKNSYDSFDGKELISSKYVSLVPSGCESCYDIIGCVGSHNYEGFSIDGNAILFSAGVFSGNTNVIYSHYCVNGGHNLFGCSSLKNAHDCILNKPYCIQEYETLCSKIIDHMRSTGEWGEFFPHEMSPFGYDETVAQEYFPLTEDEVKNMPRFEEWNGSGNIASLGREVPFRAEGCDGSLETTGGITNSHRNPPGLWPSPLPSSLKLRRTSHRGATGSGWNWKGEEETSSYHGPYYSPLPIDQYDEKIVGYETAKKNIDEVLNRILECVVTKKPFKIIRQELVFYIENHIPIPTRHPDQRHKERMQMRNPRKLFERKCTECGGQIITTYTPERPEKVVCEECYRRLVY